MENALQSRNVGVILWKLGFTPLLFLWFQLNRIMCFNQRLSIFHCAFQICVPVCLFVCLSVCICLSVCVCLSVSACLSVHLLFKMPDRLPICLYAPYLGCVTLIGLFVHLFVSMLIICYDGQCSYFKFNLIVFFNNFNLNSFFVFLFCKFVKL